jgi:hypothetical protein
MLSTPFLKLALIPEAASTLLAPMRMGYARAFSMLVMGRPSPPRKPGKPGSSTPWSMPPKSSRRAASGAGDRRAAAGAVAVTRALMRGRLDEVVERIDTESKHYIRASAIRRSARRVPGVLCPQKVRSTMSLAGKTLFITGASRGIGLAIGLRAARDGANVAIAAKTAEPHPKLAGTIYTAAEEIERAGGKALPLVVDVRDEVTVKEALDKTAAHFGGIDIVVNNASAISLTPVVATDMKRFDLMHQINTRGTFRRLEMGNPASRKGGKPAHPDDLAAARHEREVVRRAHRLQHGQVRHEPRRARACRRAAPQEDRRQRALAAHGHRHCRGAEPARRRRQ